MPNVPDNTPLDGALQAECGDASKTTSFKLAAAPVHIFPIEGIAQAAGIAISPCGTFALVGSNSEEGQGPKLGHIDLHTGALTFPYIGIEGDAYSVAISPDSTFALVID